MVGKIKRGEERCIIGVYVRRVRGEVRGIRRVDKRE